jgi:hypothetical protein
MLVDYVIESQDAGLIESILVPFDLYNDSAQHALTCLKQRFLYDEIEAEVGNFFMSHLSFPSPHCYILGSGHISDLNLL